MSLWFLTNSIKNNMMSVPYWLDFDGINDYLVSWYNEPNQRNKVPFQQRDRTQPWTFFVNLNVKSNLRYHWIFSTRLSGTSSSAWLLIWLERYWSANYIIVTMRGTNGTILQRYKTAAISNWKQTRAISYNGNSQTSWVIIYVNWLAVTMWASWNTLNASILNAHNTCLIGRDWPTAVLSTNQTQMRWMSFVDYVQTPAQILADHKRWIQSPYQWKFLFAADFSQKGGLVSKTVDWKDLNLDLIGYPVWSWWVF